MMFDMKTDDHIDLEQRVAALEDYMRVVQEKLTGVQIDTQSTDNNTQTNPSKTSNGWISVKDRLPEELEAVLVAYAPTNECKNDHRMECWNWPIDGVYETQFITHWMPLPEPPKEEI